MCKERGPKNGDIGLSGDRLNCIAERVAEAAPPSPTSSQYPKKQEGEERGK